jgi:carbamate kinase
MPSSTGEIPHPDLWPSPDGNGHERRDPEVMRILLALGGNALLPDKSIGASSQHDVEVAAAAIAGVSAEHQLVITHGSGVHGGQLLELSLRNMLPERDVVSVLSQIVVAADSPLSEPQAIAEVRSLRVLVDSGALVICAGGGSIPVALIGTGRLHWVEAVIDMDLTAALLARRLEADLLLMLTDVDAVHADWGGPGQRPIAGAEAAELRAMDFADGSMGPKVEAACRFAEATGRRAAIGALADAARIVQGEAGTQVLSAASRSSRWPARSA